ncbi:hypothetical protein V496_04698 [Pseudogymnoascus sp. VKM F-4515 (FW-2607)]|nr:hypothetical protein V496_04698 [Pseudogymnoascus sp. VKM F-4515 (FW-2607)]
MATIALPRPLPRYRSSSPIPTLSTHSINLEGINTSAACPIPIPNKHLPVCPPGPVPSEKPDTPPASPPTKHVKLQPQSLLYPPTNYKKVTHNSSAVYLIDAAGVAAAVNHISEQPLPEASQVFPWLHGLHPANHVQQAFFVARRKALRKTPECYRGVTIVKADGNLSCSRLKAAVSTEEFLQTATAEFKDIDPREGFSVRNFQIQAAKTAMLSDIIVYGEDEKQVIKIGSDIARAQRVRRQGLKALGHEAPVYHTFVCTSHFEEFEEHHPEIVVADSRGEMTGNVLDFFHQERVEMATMTKASEIARNVWLGPTDDLSMSVPSPEDEPFDLFIECSDLGRANVPALKNIARELDSGAETSQYVEFPSSGSIMPPSWPLTEADDIVESCKWIYNLANGIRPSDDEEVTDIEGDSPMPSPTEARTSRPRKILIYCTDGYTESSMLALAYYMYAHGVTVSEAYLQMHIDKRRNFFSYPSDVALLNSIAPSILSNSPALAHSAPQDITQRIHDEPAWLSLMDGSLPSRILDYMYLGNLGHANNPDLLRAMGIGQLLSVGETAAWTAADIASWGDENVCVVQGVQDNGVDPLTNEFDRCLAFINRGRLAGTSTLVHCRVGVSRSATICIAEVMRAQSLSYPRAYCFVRARRLNVIIQPHLRFSYELLKWEEMMQVRRGEGVKRELEWGEIAREIAAMNKPYSR